MVEPTGALHVVPVDELFFSTTDAKGIIDLSNSVFTRMSRYSREQLRGAPHNLIRHPEMPGAAFKVMWDTLQSGEPFAAYVRNLAADGSEYRVFATITPLADGGYLSVRSRPCDDSLYSAVSDIYAVVRKAEREAMAAGKNRREAAEIGVGVLVDTLHGAGIATYESFQNAALVSEVALREARADGFPVRSGESALVSALDKARAVYEHFSSWMSTQEILSQMATDIAQTVKRVDEDMAYMAEVGQKFTLYGADRPELASLTMPLTVWVQMQGIVGGYMDSLSAKLDELTLNVSRTQFRIALSRLHIYMYGHFVAEVLDFDEDDDSTYDQFRALVMLGEALQDDIRTLRTQTARTATFMQAVRDYVRQVAEAVAIPRQLLSLWETTADMTVRDSLGSELAATVAGAKNRADSSLRELEHFGNSVDKSDELYSEFSELDDLLGDMCEIVNAIVRSRR
ncbi:PAS domain-containing protein [Arcanobacterium buesumense]|uniref:PAS domain-containing protein n=1 Tax=Arcanobacterium buesumense TaxID=2722751 RepID=A0A6H2EML1_9ACTO|nr:PAS domain-containing protein [Arcanobacterium buesumense]QJC22318.1 PAS domain-containing protein [Arcanobacterium buesumense]